jgi:DNA-binding winged helix-turn-helix (wHTH) protein
MAHGDRSVDVFVRKLRQKLQRHSAGWRYIHTHFGIGYRFDPELLGGSPEAPAGVIDPSEETAEDPAELAEFARDAG